MTCEQSFGVWARRRGPRLRLLRGAICVAILRSAAATTIAEALALALALAS